MNKVCVSERKRERERERERERGGGNKVTLFCFVCRTKPFSGLYAEEQN